MLPQNQASKACKNKPYDGNGTAWRYMRIKMNGATLKETTRVSTYANYCPDNPDDMYSGYTDGQYQLRVYLSQYFNSSGESVSEISERYAYASCYYFLGIKGVNAYEGCAAYMQFEVTNEADGNTVHALQPLWNIQSYANAIGMVGVM